MSSCPTTSPARTTAAVSLHKSDPTSTSTLPTALRHRNNVLSKQIVEAAREVSPNDSSVEQLYKIRWRNRVFVLDGTLNKTKSRPRTSWIVNQGWFLAELATGLKVKGDVWACRRCDEAGNPTFYNAQSTSSAHTHLRKVHKTTRDNADDPPSPNLSVLEIQQGSRKRPASTPSNIPRARLHRMRELSLGYIVDCDLPFTAFESDYMKELFQQLDPDLATQLPQSRSTMARALREVFQSTKAVVKEDLSNILTKIHLSFDLWTSPNNLAIISIFGHFINHKGQTRSQLLAFRRQLGQHSGENIAYTIEKVIKDWGMEERIGVAVCDNASNNDTCIHALFGMLDPFMSNSDISARRMRCFGHILNLVAQAFLLGEDGDTFEDDSSIYEVRGQYEEDLRHWRTKGPIGKLHNIVKFIRSSPQRTEAFKRHSKEQAETVQYQLHEQSTWELELKQNNATRWNSTYLMIDRALKKKDELTSYLDKLAFESDISKRLPPDDSLSSEDWKVLVEIRNILEPLYKLTMETQGWGKNNENSRGRLWAVLTGMEYALEHLEAWKTVYDGRLADLATHVASSGPEGPPPDDSTPVVTPSGSPLPSQLRERPARQSRLPSRLDGFEIQTPTRRRRRRRSGPQFNEDAVPLRARSDYFATARERSAIEIMEAREQATIWASINNAWSKLNQYYTLIGKSPLFAAAVILNPNQGLRWLEDCWTSQQELEWLATAKEELRDYLGRWYPEAECPQGQDDAAQTERQQQERRQRRWLDEDLLAAFASGRQRPQEISGSELDRCFRLELPSDEVDPVKWWLEQKSRFPRLSALALDILAIPAMAADCERSFSSGKLILTSQRHSLNEDSIEVIQLMKDWLKSGVVRLGGMILNSKANWESS